LLYSSVPINLPNLPVPMKASALMVMSCFSIQETRVLVLDLLS
jgi:hypothetical protein